MGCIKDKVVVGHGVVASRNSFSEQEMVNHAISLSGMTSVPFSCISILAVCNSVLNGVSAQVNQNVDSIKQIFIGFLTEELNVRSKGEPTVAELHNLNVTINNLIIDRSPVNSTFDLLALLEGHRDPLVIQWERERNGTSNTST